MWHHQLKQAAKVVAEVPKVLFVLNHTGVLPLHPLLRHNINHIPGMPLDRTAKTYEEWKEGMKELAKNSNVVVKVSKSFVVLLFHTL